MSLFLSFSHAPSLILKQEKKPSNGQGPPRQHQGQTDDPDAAIPWLVPNSISSPPFARTAPQHRLSPSSFPPPTSPAPLGQARPHLTNPPRESCPNPALGDGEALPRSFPLPAIIVPFVSCSSTKPQLTPSSFCFSSCRDEKGKKTNG
ncbi:hypothetical protein BS50DRAFT_570515 [Corynespora cassiicola Philippines]|uniref:Uncharacterized protein n=1 Tax=Corynespora cassiicola Philippines TaxID=1448308 RepID=A0A2T2P0R1_CORCC|nr:hypothetical protein BS50DRAFT_570515 [Corynespora cassiicola Philippines]